MSAPVPLPPPAEDTTGAPTRQAAELEARGFAWEQASSEHVRDGDEIDASLAQRWLIVMRCVDAAKREAFDARMRRTGTPLCLRWM
jgi:hypothetical protein